MMLLVDFHPSYNVINMLTIFQKYSKNFRKISKNSRKTIRRGLDEDFPPPFTDHRTIRPL